MKGYVGGDFTEFAPRSTNSGEALSWFMYQNLPVEAQQAMRDRIIEPTVNELIRLTGIELDGLPPLAVPDLVGPTKVSDLDPAHQAFYFSGSQHPVIARARKLPTFVTYHDMLRISHGLGIRQDMVTRNFRGLVMSLFEDDTIATFGSPHEHLAGRTLHRFAVRRKMAQLAMTGEYRVGISGTHKTHIFNGYGRALINSLYEPTQGQRLLELTMELEAMPHLLMDPEDPSCFGWGKTYRDVRGIGYKMNDRGLDGPIYGYLYDLLTEIGAIADKDSWTRAKIDISEQAFAMAVNALCSLDSNHAQTIKSGHACIQGVHAEGLTTKSVSRAQSIAACITRAEDSTEEEEEINLLDPGFQVSATPFEW